MLWVCNDCTAKYSVDAPRCPQCGSTNHRDDGTLNPKYIVGEEGPELIAINEDGAPIMASDKKKKK